MKRSKANHTWRKALTRAAVCLLLGAATTVGVAWGFAWRINNVTTYRELAPLVTDDWSLTIAAPGQEWHIRAQRMTAYSVVSVRANSSFDESVLLQSRFFPPRPSKREAELRAIAESIHNTLPLSCLEGTDLAAASHLGWIDWPTVEDSRGRAYCCNRAAGWPVLALRQGCAGVSRNEYGCLTVGSGSGYPYLPIFRGFLSNTLFYAIPWWFLLLAPVALRRWRRRRRGRCVKCGYNLSGLPAEAGAIICPECGN